MGLVTPWVSPPLAVGHLNILTITFVPILIGLAIDFGVHLITRYEEELRHGRSETVRAGESDREHRAWEFSPALLRLPARFSPWRLRTFKGIQEMGIICGGGLLVCLIPMMTLLPVLLLRGRQNVIDHERARAGNKAAVESGQTRAPGKALAAPTLPS